VNWVAFKRPVGAKKVYLGERGPCRSSKSEKKIRMSVEKGREKEEREGRDGRTTSGKRGTLFPASSSLSIDMYRDRIACPRRPD